MKNKQYCELHEHEIIAEVVDYHTGDSDPLLREQGKHLLDKDPEGIVFFSMDRFTRQHPTKVFQMITRLKDQGVKIISITEPAFNMEGEFAEIIIFLITWFNNYFLIKLKRDIKSGMDRARQKGKQIGRKKATFNKVLAYKLLFTEHLSQREVARLLNTSLATINRFKRDTEKAPPTFIGEAAVAVGCGSETDIEENTDVSP
jgi:DNA invertase Pin-like site-specific DNA recombinase